MTVRLCSVLRRFQTGVLVLFFLAVAVRTLGCTEQGQDVKPDRGVLNFVVLGQALIEHDPRPYLEQPLASVVSQLADADVVFTNLEVAIHGESCDCRPMRNDIYFHGAGPEVLDYLNHLGVNLLSLSNNHSWDYGAPGILSTRAEASRRGIVHAGTGSTLAEAVAPAYLEAAGQRVVLVAAVTADLAEEAPATATRPGVNALLSADTAAWHRNLAAIRTARTQADWVVVYQHYQNQPTDEAQIAWARAAVDAGADLYVSHGAPRLKGVEVYAGKLILYGLGNFIFHTKTNIGHYAEEVWESVLVQLTLHADGPSTATFIPLVLDEGRPGARFLETRGYPEVAKGAKNQRILERLAALSQPFGTSFAIAGDRAVLRLYKAGQAK